MSSIAESYKAIPMNLNHIIPLDFNGVHEIPESHEWTISTEHPIVDPVTCDSLPLIDLSDPNALSLIRKACEEWGAFQVINHGIPLNLFEEVELQTRRLFSLPTHQKLTILRSPDSITGYGMPHIQTFFPKLMWSEGFQLIGYPMEYASQLWPQEPDQQTNFCDVMEKYQKEMKAFTEKLFEMLLGSLGLTLEDIHWFKPTTDGSNNHQNVLTLNSYPVCPDPNRTMGLAPHTDTSLITVLHQSGSTGLQVLKDGSGWVPVVPVSGALVVNLGDLMEVLTNGLFKSIMHRAVANMTNHRVSVAFFFGPPRDVEIAPLVKLTDEDHPALYCPLTWKEFLQTKAKHFDKALEVLRNKGAKDNLD
ncbi:hypothetical protein L6164_000283 [Bauhinia variegata]|uniref:Uncharacterized protein n=1 Tax=Bauhinia variegata TaxID=167791 RepID=A0ACB9Q591_BAUVA|nr:hypothetical protein L6164_000283 [Bauhinia variegata]